ncbi:hypothetical protein RB195_018877 [Necator americanus]|uniref:Uncharacterized protein n=1 Tax=Necator americanus TaxID=51031 RepID=A0ABR1CBM3_NECAM
MLLGPGDQNQSNLNEMTRAQKLNCKQGNFDFEDIPVDHLSSFTLKLPCLLFSSFKVFYTVFSFLCWTDLTDCFCKLITLVKFKKKNVPTTNSCIQIV